MFGLFKRGIINREHFNKYRNKLTVVLRLSKQHYYSTLFNNASNNIKKTWTLINKTLNRSNEKKMDQLKINNAHISDDHEMAEAFNLHFATVAPNLNSGTANNLVALTNVPRLANSAVFLHSDPSEIYNAILNLKLSHNLAMPTRALKLLAPFISGYLSKLYNICLDSGFYPDALKIARVTPIFKSGDRADPGNYRPISILSDINKIFENLTLIRVNSYLKKYNIISQRQYGFRRGVSTQEACVDVVSMFLKAFTFKQFALGIFIDFKKAFDSVDHGILLAKLENYGFRGNILNFLKSYLTNRQQYVVVNGTESHLINLTAGIPQGSTLGPTLFNLFVNDISNL